MTENNTKTNNLKDFENQSQLLEDYNKLLNDRESSKAMIDYYNKECSYILTLSDGSHVIFKKPRIETSFCFGYGQYGISTDEEQKSATEMADYARENQNYFLEENLRQFNHKIDILKAYICKLTNYDQWVDQYLRSGTNYDLSNYEICAYKHASKFDYFKISSIHIYNADSIYNKIDNENETVITNIDDLKNILSVYEYEKAKFEKRLNTYLKKYGLSKLKTWSYLVD